MRAMRIDFSQPSVRRAIWRTPPVVWPLMLAVFVLSLYGAIGYWHYLAGLREYEAAKARLRMRAAGPTAQTEPAGHAPLSQARVSAVNGIIDRLNLPWPALFDAVQIATPPGVALLALEPDAGKQVVRITAEARGSDDMFAYIEQLQRQGFFSAVSLLRHEISEPDPNHSIRFQLDAQWRRRQ